MIMSTPAGTVRVRNWRWRSSSGAPSVLDTFPLCPTIARPFFTCTCNSHPVQKSFARVLSRLYQLVQLLPADCRLLMIYSDC